MENETLDREVRRALSNFHAKMQGAGVKKTDIVKCNVYLTSMDYYAPVNVIYTEFFGTHKPARTCIAVRALPNGARLEIEGFGVIESRMPPKL